MSGIELLLGKKKTDPIIPEEDGFYGEVTNDDLISYRDFMTLCGFPTNTPVYGEGSGWLMFVLDGKLLYVAKKYLTNNLSWNDLYNRGLVTGSKTLVIKEKSYKVRLIRGADTDPATFNAGVDPVGTRNSEWSRLFYPIVKNDFNIPADIRNPNAPYTMPELSLNSFHTWCSDTPTANPQAKIVRGYQGPTQATWITATTAGTSMIWKPIIELVP